jgi:hypothetical protein
LRAAEGACITSAECKTTDHHATGPTRRGAFHSGLHDPIAWRQPKLNTMISPLATPRHFPWMPW